MLCSNMPPSSRPVIEIITVVEFGLGVQVVLGKRRPVCPEVGQINREVGIPIKAVLDGGDRTRIEWSNHSR
jgi:hypothetical protein